LGAVWSAGEKYPTGDMIDYYRAVSPWLLPYLRNRPLVMTRYPDGIDGARGSASRRSLRRHDECTKEVHRVAKLKEPIWRNTTIIRDNVIESVRALKAYPTGVVDLRYTRHR
jgi:DNA primase